MSFPERVVLVLLVLMLVMPSALVISPRRYIRFFFARLRRDWLLVTWHFRYEVFDTKLGWYIISHSPIRRIEDLAFKWKRDRKLVEKEIFDEDGEKATIGVLRFSEKDVRKREQFLAQPASTEESRRGRSRRGRDNTIQLQRIRQFNFEYGLRKWDFVFPDEEWSEAEGKYVPHPKAGEPVPITREFVEEMGANISEQINDILNEVNEPPAELPEIRDEQGNVIEEAVETPTELSFAAS